MTKKLTGLALTVSRTHESKARRVFPPRYLAPDGAGTGAADMLVLVGDQFGRVIGELDGRVEGVAFKLSDYGQMRMTLARAGAQERLLRPGNRLLIQFGNGLPDWGGVLDLPRRWRDGRIEIVGYSGEYLLKWRITERGRYFRNQTAGAIFQALLQEALPSGVTFGAAWKGEELHSPEYHYRDLYDIFTKSLSSRIEAADWYVRPELVGGQIFFTALYYQQRGKDHERRLALIEGINAVEVDMQEQGPIINDYRLAGAGTGWGETTRIYAAATSRESGDLYGLRQRGEVRVEVSEQETLDRSAEVAVAESAYPRAVVGLTTLDRPPARWGQYDVGDSIWMELYEEGFGGYGATVRVTAREFLPARGVCSLVIE